MINNNGNNGGGNPNHDENGRFTSKGNASSGKSSEEKTDKEVLAKAQDFVKNHFEYNNSKEFENRVMGVYQEMMKEKSKEASDSSNKKVLKQMGLDEKDLEPEEQPKTNNDNDKKHNISGLNPYTNQYVPLSFKNEDGLYRTIFNFLNKNDTEVNYNGLIIPRHAIIGKVFDKENGGYRTVKSVNNLKKWIDENGYTQEYKPHVPAKKEISYRDGREDLRKWLKNEKGINEPISIEEEGYYNAQRLMDTKQIKNLEDLISWREDHRGWKFDDDPYFRGIDRYIEELKKAENK
ncbi:MAG: hypothetical protein K5765_06845 [Clostridia bacterium]|nr:hypothetical protein [Clostridia bacterium]